MTQIWKVTQALESYLEIKTISFRFLLWPPLDVNVQGKDNKKKKIQKWDDQHLELLRGLIKQIIWQHRSETRAMPKGRKYHKNAMPNVEIMPEWEHLNDLVHENGFGSLFDPIDKCTTVTKLLRKLNWDKREDLSWNLTNLTAVDHKDPNDNLVKPVIEYRRPPPVSSPGAVLHWIAFPLGFAIDGMTRKSWENVKSTKTCPSSTAHLRRHIVDGLVLFCKSAKSALGPVTDSGEIVPNLAYIDQVGETIKVRLNIK